MGELFAGFLTGLLEERPIEMTISETIECYKLYIATHDRIKYLTRQESELNQKALVALKEEKSVRYEWYDYEAESLRRNLTEDIDLQDIQRQFPKMHSFPAFLFSVFDGSRNRKDIPAMTVAETIECYKLFLESLKRKEVDEKSQLELKVLRLQAKFDPIKFDPIEGIHQ